MTKDIIRKLREHLSHPVDTECAVVYLLAEIRKLLDAHKPAPKPFALWMYCHWALHVDLTKSNTTMHFLERVDAFVINTVAGFKGNAAYSIIDSHNLFREFVYLDAFREQLLAILASYDMPTELCDDDEAWFRFMSAYAGVVEDGALSSETDKTDTLQAVEKVVFSKGGNPLAEKSHLPFVIQWDIVLKDGRVCRVELEATPQLKMIAHDVQLLAGV